MTIYYKRSLIITTHFSMKDNSSEFSRFFRTASSKEKKKVFLKIAKEANEEQRKVFNKMDEEKNKYALLQVKRDYSSSEDKDGTQKFQQITFYKMNEDGSSENGTTLEELLRVGIERLTDLNSKFACRENSIAITKMQEALLWLNERTRERKERGVEGKHEK